MGTQYKPATLLFDIVKIFRKINLNEICLFAIKNKNKIAAKLALCRNFEEF